METKEIKQLAFDLIEKAAEEKLARLSFKSKDFSLTVETVAPAAPVVLPAAPAAAPVAAAPAQAAAAPAAPEAEEYSGTIVPAPLVGTFYASASPEDAPFVQVGDTVQAGDTLCIIEAMKTMNSIESPASGKITRIFVDNGALVEYHQPLFVIE